MKQRQTSRTTSHQAVEARAALEALFGQPSASPTQDQTLEGDALIARKAADAKSISSRIDFLRRKREAMQEIQREAASRGFTTEDLRALPGELANG